MARQDKSLVTSQLLLKLGGWRYPFFMVDRIVDLKLGSNGGITVTKNCSFNEPYIPGHFPDNPVVPGVMVAEIFGQASEYYTLLCDFCRVYHEEKGIELKKFDDVSQALKTREGVDMIMKIRNNLFGFLAAQDLKFRHVVQPGDVIYVESQLAFADVNGFHHYNVEARVGRHVACTGKIINFRNTREQAKKYGILFDDSEL